MVCAKALAFLLLAAGPLDAPVQQTPTVRSEIVRGFDAGTACKRTALAYLDTCYRSVLERYRVSNANTSAYEVGLAFAKWTEAALRRFQ